MFLLAPFVLAAYGVVVFALDVSVPVSAPSKAPTVSPALVSFSIEQDRWLDWAGSTSRNEFAYNAFNNLKEITGTPPWIRIGADSEDHTNFNPRIQFSQTKFPAETATVPYPEASNITVGDGFYSAVAHLPPGTHVIWGVNFGQANLTAAYLETRSIVKAFDSPAVREAGITLDFIEIGNEADLYINNGARNSSWNIQQYVAQWTTFAANVSAAAGINADSRVKFVGAAFAESTRTTSGFSPQSAFKAGLLDSPSGAQVKLISQHHYSGSFCSGSGGLLQNLMTKATIRSNLSSFSPDITATHAKGLSYFLGETNSYSCHGAPGVSNTAGAALWALDYALYSSQIGVERTHFHEGIGYKYNLIQPATLNRSILDGSPLSTPLAPHIQPAYYSAIIVAEALGDSGSTQVYEISVNNTRIAGYAFYEGGSLQRAVFINSLAFLKGATSRSSTHLLLSFTDGSAFATMTIKRLKIGYADDTSGVTWGGQTYETSDAKVSGDLDVQVAPVSAGVDIAETEVVLLTFGS
ncbi:glycoside hydrolase family 79 protein [Plicaturopsis crispa FD-325 SS-3]|uniref:Unplaced genomic scaffold PLICRscaffold_18, whole genome shotgun sequence n=1 Tax=Plicaturopsis crispa FD-325 SS-3 TaxID=944288 RepID=A0A0C9SXL3_PLICR|nr:glycoside hydrolase family 79 protein [Plicaturopsis crispa FD-325 SS-3]